MEEDLEEIRKEVLKCRKCGLYRTRTNPVVGEGNPKAKIMFVGEAPGFNEDRMGRPFCGAAGRVLDELLESIGIKREDVYISNLLKCRPPENRDPQKEEISACSPYLERQIEIIKPKIICPLGRYSMRFLMEKYGLKDRIEPISRIHGRVFEISSLFQEIKIIPLYHPAVATYNINMKEVLKRDFRVLEKFR
ncbi:MAG TPA: uracil-DNA glycosylase [bacterium]|nr:uracil-DNA glycosylase [bacterium]